MSSRRVRLIEGRNGPCLLTRAGAVPRAGTLGSVDREGSIKLLSAILADLPRLDGAACIGHHDLYDEQPEGRSHQRRDEQRARGELAAAGCAGCPVRARCPSRWTDRPFPRAAEMKIQIAG